MPSYDFSQLSPFDFEMLVHSLLESEWAFPLEGFKAGRDGGIDLRYACATSKRETIVQCKHYVQSGFSKLYSHLKASELPKISALAPDRYVLVTSVGLTPANKADLQALLSPYIKTTGDVIGQTELNQLLTKFPDVEQKNFKLWLTSKAVLDQVIHNAELCQTDFVIERIAKRLPLYVQNHCYPHALKMLENGNVLMISGEPGVGKTTLADILLFTYLNSGYKPVVIKTDLREGRSLYSKGEKQIFYYDDFLGQTFLHERQGFSLKNEDAALVDFVEMIQASKDAKLIMTTREHILSNALLSSDRLKRSALIDNKCIIRVADYSRNERATILYNHIVFSELPDVYKQALIGNSFYEQILRHGNFNPRLIEWLASYRRIRPIDVKDYRAFVLDILESPQEIWQEAFRHQISESARSFLLALFSLGGKTTTLISELAWRALSTFQSRKYNYALSTAGFSLTLKELEGSFITIGIGGINFINPSVKDFLSQLIAEDKDKLDDLMQGAATFDQVHRVWQWSKKHERADIAAIMHRGNSSFLDAIERTLAGPYRQQIQTHYGLLERAIDLYPEARLSALLSMAEDVESERLITLVPGSSEAVFTRWDEMPPDFEEAVDILETIESSRWLAANLQGDTWSNVRRRMYGKLQCATSYLDFFHVENYASTSKKNESDAEAQMFSAAFNNYMQDSFRDELGDIASQDDNLSEMAGFLSKMMKEYGYSISNQYDSLMEIISEREEYAEQRADHEYDSWKDQRGFERADDEAISSMFDSLR